MGQICSFLWTHKNKRAFSFGGRALPQSHPGSPPGPPLEASPPDPSYRLALRARHGIRTLCTIPPDIPPSDIFPRTFPPPARTIAPPLLQVSRFSINKSLYLANDTRYRHSYYGRRIGTRMRSIKWCHFQWPWTNPNPVFKVTPLFDAKYLTNGYRYGHSYYKRRVGNRTQAFEWHQFQWPWVTSKPDFKVTVLFNVK